MKVALVIWTNPDYYVAIKYTSQIFIERGHEVDILCRNTNETFMGDVDYPKAANTIRIGSKREGIQNLLSYLGFLVNVYRKKQKAGYDLIIGYDLYGFVAAFLMTALGKKPLLLYHNFDLSEKFALGFVGRQLKRFEYIGARRARAVIFPSLGRAEVFKQEANLYQQPLIVMNCLRVTEKFETKGIFRKMLAEEGIKAERLVARLGSIGPGHGIEATIRSVKMWKGDWALVFLGVALGSYMSSMQELVAQLGLSKRILFKSEVSYEMWNDCLNEADVGLALYEPININHLAMAGAGQKMFFYLQVGMPVVLPRLQDFTEILDKYKFGVGADADSAESIASAVNSLLGSQQEYEKYARNAKEAFVNELNFDTQFSQVLRLLGPNFDDECFSIADKI